MHVDLATVAALEGAPLQRALRHARGCDACRAPVERLLFATRVLERGSPWEPTEAESTTATEAGLEVALRAARPPRRWQPFAGLGVALVAAASFFVVVVLRPPEFTERGGRGGSAVLRMFCATEQGSLRELPSGASCPAGSKLALAAAARPELSSVALRMTGPDGVRLLGPFPVSGRPGAEAPLAVTPQLSTPGTVEVDAAFAPTPEAAQAALRGDRAPGAVVVHQRLRVEDKR